MSSDFVILVRFYSFKIEICEVSTVCVAHLSKQTCSQMLWSTSSSKICLYWVPRANFFVIKGKLTGKTYQSPLNVSSDLANADKCFVTLVTAQLDSVDLVVKETVTEFCKALATGNRSILILIWLETWWDRSLNLIFGFGGRFFLYFSVKKCKSAAADSQLWLRKQNQLFAPTRDSLLANENIFASFTAAKKIRVSSSASRFVRSFDEIELILKLMNRSSGSFFESLSNSEPKPGGKSQSGSFIHQKSQFCCFSEQKFSDCN